MAIKTLYLVAEIGGVLAILALVGSFFVRRWFLKVPLLLLVPVLLAPAGLLAAIYNPWLVDARFRTFRQFYHDIRPGMTREDVLVAMERRYPEGGPRKRPTIMVDEPEHLGFFMNPETEREPNCEGIFLGLKGGRVTTVGYGED